MRLTIRARQELTKATAGQYHGARKKEKRRILDQFVNTTGYSRWYARRFGTVSNADQLAKQLSPVKLHAFRITSNYRDSW